MKDFKCVFDFQIRIYFDTENKTNVYAYASLNVWRNLPIVRHFKRINTPGSGDDHDIRLSPKRVRAAIYFSVVNICIGAS